MALQQVAFFARPSRPTLTYIDSYVSNTQNSSYNFTVVNNAAGLIIVTFAGQSSVGTARTLSSHTIDGSAGTEVITRTQTNASGTGATAGIVARRITTTSNFVVNITFSGIVTGCRIGAWRLTNNVSDTASHTGGAGANPNVSSLSTTLTAVPLNSVIIAVECVGETNRRPDWGGGFVEQYDANMGATAGTSGANDKQTSDGNFTVSLSHSPSVSGTCALAAAAWI